MRENQSRYRIFWIVLAAGFLLALLQIAVAISSYRAVTENTVPQALAEIDRRNVGLQFALRPALEASGEINAETAGTSLQEFFEEAKDEILWIRIVNQAGTTIAEAGAPEGTDLHWDRVGAGVAVKHGAPVLQETTEGTTIVEIYGLWPPPPPGGGRGGGGRGRGGPPPDGEFGGPDGGRGRGGPPPDGGESGGGRGGFGPRSGALPGQTGQPNTASGAQALPGTQEGGRGTPPAGISQPAPLTRRDKPPNAVQIAIPLKRVSAFYEPLRGSLTSGIVVSLTLMLSLVLISWRLPRYLRGQRIEGQLELARAVQTDLLAPPHIVSPQVDFAVECIPAWEVGGDFCDVFSAGQDRVAFVLGDVSGKGISAALLMGLIHGAVHSLSWTDSAEEHQAASRHLNELLCRKTARERFSSLFWACFDPEASVLNYVNAGHLPPMLLRPDAKGGFETERLDVGGTVLGLISGVAYRQGHAKVKEGDILVIFSDGISEAGNANSEEFGERRLLNAVHESWNRPAAEIRDAVFARLKTFLHNTEADDDQTLIVARFQHVTARERSETMPAEPVRSQHAG